MDAGKIPGKRAAETGRGKRGKQAHETGPKESVTLGGKAEMARVDKLIANLQAGKVEYPAEVAAKIRSHDLTPKNFPCDKYVLKAGVNASELPTEIVARKEEPKYKHSVTIESNLSAKESEKDLKHRVQEIHSQADELYAQATESLLVILEGDNADGKDGMLKHVFQLNPQTNSGQKAFKGANAEERQHDPNWRIMQHLPGPGQIGFHNRSAWGDVVFAAKTEDEKLARAANIKEMEYGLTMGLPMTPEGHIAVPDPSGKLDPSSIQRPPMRILKVLLSVSKAEQAARLAERLLDDSKLYKASAADIEGHDKHDEVQNAYTQAMALGNTEWAPTYIIPNDNKLTGWRKMGEIVDEVLDDMDPQTPTYHGELSPRERRALAKPLLAEVEAAKNRD